MSRCSAVLLILGSLAVGCSDSETCAPEVVTTDQECSTTNDCVEAGFKALSCVNGTCARPCLRDADCALGGSADGDDDDACGDKSTALTFICESELCKKGCPDEPCGEGETCTAGRCTLFAESFELRADQEVATLENLGWNGLPRELENRRTKIVYSGAEGCSLGDERCAGPAADGVRFVSLERVPTPERGTENTEYSCRACACCLECRLNPPANGSLAQIPNCPGAIARPDDLVCAESVPGVCSGVCTQCESCAMAPAERMIGTTLLTCELDAAKRTCSSCLAYEACIRDHLPACGGGSGTCDATCRTCVATACDAMRPACFACSDAAQCDVDTPGSSACIALHATCDAQGADGCYLTVADRPRSQLTETEQALTSPVIAAVAGQSGRVVLQFEYVPFDVGEQYVRVIQGMPRATWPRETQEVTVELCGGGCDDPSHWTIATLKGGARASLPPEGQRRNGLPFSAQSSIDWRSSRVEVDIPEALRTGELRFRLVPRLGDDARIGIDNVIVRRRP